MATFVHPRIGRVVGVGKESGAVTQFLGLKYANLKDRFAEAQLVGYSGKGLDATKYGCVLCFWALVFFLLVCS